MSVGIWRPRFCFVVSSLPRADPARTRGNRAGLTVRSSPHSSLLIKGKNWPQPFRHPHGVDGFLDVMGSNDMGTIVDRNRRASEGAAQTISRVGLIQDFANERLARDADQEWEPKDA